jgi:hypothetical protein
MTFFLSMLIMAIAFQNTYSQSLRTMMRNKIIEDQLKKQAKEDSIKAAEEGREPEDKPTTMDEVYMEAFGLRGNVDYESTYKFNSHFQMEVSEFSNSGKLKEKTLYDSYVNNGQTGYAMVFKDNKDRSIIIFDAGNSSMLMLTDSDGEKTGVAIAIDPETMADESDEADEETGGEAINTYRPKKTGKTKTILGYRCEEYLVDDEESEAHMWVSEKLGKQVRKEMLKNQQTFGAAFYYAAYMDGMVMEYDLLEKESGERTVMQVTGIDLDQPHSISTRDYSIMSMRQPSGE